jgi:hypothetical protein
MAKGIRIDRYFQIDVFNDTREKLGHWASGVRTAKVSALKLIL